MPITIEALAAELAELRAEVRKPKRRKDRRTIMTFRLDDDEAALVSAAARQKGVCMADLIRMGLNSVIGSELRINREIPDGLRRFTLRRKSETFDDGKTDHARNAAERIRSLNLEAQSLRIAADDALTSRTTAGQGMLAQPRPTKFPR